MSLLEVKNFGPILEANVNIRDFTIFVGPQATGKSLLLQLFKLIIDRRYISETLEKYSISQDNYFSYYFGHNVYEAIYDKNLSELYYNSKRIDLPKIFNKRILNKLEKHEKVFYIPAQRIITLYNGSFRLFTDFDISVPFIYRNFSDTLRLFVQDYFLRKSKKIIFPRKGVLKSSLKNEIQKTIYGRNTEIVIEDFGGFKRFILNLKDNRESNINLMSWSAGQKEFFPLLISLYKLIPSSKTSKRNFEYIIIEEPEMGLHPKAIVSVMLLLLELISRGYKIIISTHSQIFIELVYGLKFINNVDDLFKLFEIKKQSDYDLIKAMFSNFLSKKDKSFSVYYFQPHKGGIIVKDISSLDPFSEDSAENSWGELLEFSNKIDEIILNSE